MVIALLSIIFLFLNSKKHLKDNTFDIKENVKDENCLKNKLKNATWLVLYNVLTKKRVMQTNVSAHIDILHITWKYCTLDELKTHVFFSV